MGKKIYVSDQSAYSEKWLPVVNFFQSSVLDRTNTVKDFGFEYKVFSPITEFSQTNESLRNVAVQRAHQLKSKISSDKKIKLLWSGGIDSTLSFFSLQEAGVEFDVIHTEDSIIEYPELYVDIKRGKYGK